MRFGPWGRWTGAQFPPGPLLPNRTSRQALGLVLWVPGLASRGGSVYRDLAGIAGSAQDGTANASPSPGWEASTLRGMAYSNGDGAGNASVRGTAVALLATGGITYSAWARRTSANASGEAVLSITGSGDVGFNLYAARGAGPTIQSSNEWTGWAFDDSGVASVALGQWALYTFTVTGAGASGTATLYLNGRPIWTGTRTGDASAPVKWWMGLTPAMSTQFNGAIDDVRGYNRALSPAEVWQLYDPATRWALYRAPFLRSLGAAIAVQYLRPASDVATGTWTPVPASPTTLYTKLDEAAADDADYAYSATYPASDVMTVSLSSATDPVSSSGHVVRYRYRNNNGGGQGTLQIELLEGTTVLDTWSHTGITSNSWVTASRTLSGAVADSITDYTSLRLRFTASVG